MENVTSGVCNQGRTHTTELVGCFGFFLLQVDLGFFVVFFIYWEVNMETAVVWEEGQTSAEEI